VRRGWELGRFAALGAALGAATWALPAEVPAALAVLGALMLPVLAWLVLRAPREQADALLPIVLGAVAARVAVALAIHYAVPADYFSVDQGRYQLMGLDLARHWAGAGPYPDEIGQKPGYYAWNALVYTLVGYAPLAATLGNVAVAAVSVILTWRMANDLAGPRAARLAALFAAFFPSLVLWSSLNLKDAAAILGILLALRGAQRLLRRLQPLPALQLALGLTVVSELRDYLVLILVAAIASAFLLTRLRGLRAVPLVAAACCAALFAGSMPVRVERIDRLTEDASFQSLDRQRHNLALGSSAYHGDVDISTPHSALRFLPLGLAYFLLAPAPWQVLGSRQWLTLPEMLAWYALIPQVFFGLRALWRRRVAGALPAVAFGLLATVSYALVESNLGTAYRHRAQVLLIYLVFAAIGIAERSERAAARGCRLAVAEPSSA
jgi:4-amino-4-deoxy-L-arabinose transferase-like glycosyltransferase